MKKITTKETSQIINVMFSRVPDERRQKIYNHIDELMMNYFNVEEKDIPWLNKDINKHENYNNILNILRLSVAKIFNEYAKYHIDAKLN